MGHLPLPPFAANRHAHNVVVEYWFPAYGHPDGASNRAWFRVVDGFGYRTTSHPGGSSAMPCFRVRDGGAFPIVSLLGSPATFDIIGSFAYTAIGPPWFFITQSADRAMTPTG
jgi:hypothetical protein